MRPLTRIARLTLSDAFFTRAVYVDVRAFAALDDSNIITTVRECKAENDSRVYFTAVANMGAQPQGEDHDTRRHRCFEGGDVHD